MLAPEDSRPNRQTGSDRHTNKRFAVFFFLFFANQNKPVMVGGGGGGGGGDDGRDWMPLKGVDYCMLVLVSTCQVFALAVCLHLFLNRHWPPYVTKNVTLVIVTVRTNYFFTYLGRAVPLSNLSKFSRMFSLLLNVERKLSIFSPYFS